MTDNLEQAGKAVDDAAAEAKPVVQGIIAHIETYAEAGWKATEAEVEELYNYLKTKL